MQSKSQPVHDETKLRFQEYLEAKQNDNDARFQRSILITLAVFLILCKRNALKEVVEC